MGHAISQIRISSPFRLRTDLHLARKLWHILTGSIGLVAYFRTGVSAELTATILLIVSVLGFGIDFLRLRNEKINLLVLALMKPVMRESEKTSVSGLPFYALGVSLSLFFFPTKLAILSILFLIFADPIASFIGILYGRDKILPNKSLQGTVAAFAVCYVATLVYGLVHHGSSMNLLVFAIFGGLVGALSELCSQYVDDNLCIPVLSGLGLTIINLFIPLF
jgi:diacylglycerol kinase (CTP)